HRGRSGSGGPNGDRARPRHQPARSGRAGRRRRTREEDSSVSMRTHWCGELRPEHIDQQVSLCGWVDGRREHGEHLAFVDVRDRTGIVQCVVDGAHDVRSEYVVRITGTVYGRPAGYENDKLATGSIEVKDCSVEILS